MDEGPLRGMRPVFLLARRTLFVIKRLLMTSVVVFPTGLAVALTASCVTWIRDLPRALVAQSLFGDRIVATHTKRITAQYAPHTEDQTH